MASTNPPHPRVPSLLTMPPEILQDIFWRSLELSLCHVSRIMYQTLPSYPRLAQFLPVLAFGSDRIIDKIIHNDGDDCSDVVKKLSIATPLGGKDRVTLQLAIMDSGWFDFSNFVEISHTLEEYLIQQFWVEKGITVEPRHVDKFEKRNANLSDALDVHGRTQDGQLCQLSVQSFEVRVLYSNGSWSFPEFSSLCEEEKYRMLHIRCIPNRILKAPLAPADYGPPVWRRDIVHRCRLSHNVMGPIPSFWHLIYGMDRFGENDPDYMNHVVVSPQAVELAISEAVSTANLYVLEGILRLRLSADGESTLQPLTAGHFIAAARRADYDTMHLLWGYGYYVIPFNNSEMKDSIHDTKMKCLDRIRCSQAIRGDEWWLQRDLEVVGMHIDEKVAAHILRSR